VETYDVAVVGAGPVGLYLALRVAQRGPSVIVLEKRPTPYPLPRAVHFDDETARLLAQAVRPDAYVYGSVAAAADIPAFADGLLRRLAGER
jgi:2-polyprenyl-6-methoxyphenol hydroxylase-like FAD-dependent oxidoreductase